MPDWTARRLALGAAALLATFVVSFLLRWTALTIPLGMALVVLVPGLAVLRLLRLDTGLLVERLTLAATFSVTGGAALATFAALWGVRPGLAMAAVVLLAVGVLFVVRAPAAGAGPPTGVAPTGPAAEAAGADRLALAVAIGSMLIVLVPWFNPWVRNWSDAWFHFAAFNEVLLRGVPPDFPHFAGQPLPYPWLFHVWLVALAEWMTPDPGVLIGALDVAAAGLLPCAASALALRLGASPRAAGAAALVMMLGVNPFGFAMIFARGLIGATRGWDLMMLDLASTGSVQWSQTFRFYTFDSSLWARFWIATAFAVALGFAGATLSLAARVWQTGRPRDALALALSIAGLFLWHTLTALAVAAGLAGACAFALAAALRDPAARARAFRRTVAIGAAGAAGYALAMPYLRIVTQGASGGQLMRPRLIEENVWGLVISGSVLALVALAGLRRRSASFESRAWRAGLALAFVVLFLTFDLPGSAEDKLFYPMMLVFAALAAPVAVSIWDRGGIARLALRALGTLTVVAALATAGAFARDARPIRELFTASLPGTTLFSADEARALAWIRDQSPVDAIYLQAPRPFSNEPILVHGARRLYLGPAEFFYRAIFFPTAARPPVDPAVWAELKRRERVQTAVFTNVPLAPDLLRELARGPGPLYIWWDRELADGRLSPSIAADHRSFVPVFTSPQVRLYEVRLGREGTPR